MKKRFTRILAAFALLVFMMPSLVAWGQTRESYNVTYAYSDLGDMLSGSYDDANSYWKVPKTSGDNAVISIPITYQPTSNITVTFHIATFGSGTNPSSSNTTITAVGTETSSNWSGSDISSYPSSSTYVDGVMTITKPDNPTTLGGLDITMGVNTGVKIFRLQSVTVYYTYGGGGTQPETYTVTFDAGDGTFVGNNDFPNASNTKEAGTYTLPSATPADGYTFDGWALGEDTYAGGASYTVNGNADFVASYTENTTPGGEEHWVLTNLADLTANDVFVIVGNNGSNYAMKNSDASNTGPVVVAVTVDGNELTGTIGNNIKWNISGNASDGYIFYPNGSSTTWLYCTNNNNGLRIGNGNTDYNTFEIKDSYIYNKGRGRYVGIYNSTDWRSYTSIGTNIANQTFAFYKKVTGDVIPPSITANDVEIGYNATSGSITYTINNGVEGGAVTSAEVTASNPENWLTVNGSSPYTSPISLSCAANTSATEKTATVTLTYTYNRETVTATVNVTQAAAPVIYTTIPDLFAAATTTETEVYVTFNNYVVSGVSTNGKNVYVTDNSGNGFIIYFTSDMSETFSAGKKLSGTAVSCKLKLYSGAAELVELDADDLTITDGGTVSIVNIAMASLSGVNTGALVSYENLTCSVDNNKYYLTDGTTTVQAYNTLYAFDEFEAGKTYNVTGVYVQYNTVKEIAPRSADDIEEVEIPVEEYTLTVTVSENAEIYTFIGDATNGIEGATEQQVANGTEVGISASASEGYVLTLMVDGVDVTAEMDETGYYTFTMPTHDVTVSATAEEYVAPTPSNYVRISSLSGLTDGSKVIIAARHNATAGSYYAMKNVTSGKPEGTQFTSATSEAGETVASTITDDEDNYYWTVNVTENGFTFTNASNQKIGYNDGTNFATNQNTEWTIERENAGNNAMVPGYEGFVIRNITTNTRAFAFNGSAFGAYSTTANLNASGYNFFLDFFVQTSEPAGYTLTINGYTDDNSKTGYYLIASPVSVDPATVEGMTTGDFDLYYFDQNGDDEGKEWINWESNPFTLEPGTGYLYAKKATTQGEVFNFTLTGEAYDGTGYIELTYNTDAEFAGWNLIGNPFATQATLDKPYYRLEEGAVELTPEDETVPVNAMEGVFVSISADDLDLETGECYASFTTVSKSSQHLALNLSRNERSASVVDRAIVRFDGGRTLPKFQLNPNNTKIYVTEGNQDYAIVRSAAEAEMPVSFRASENGTYTLAVEAENVEMNYLHLIDNLTGMDVDLLQTPSYTFEAKTSDYASRFRLVFKANGTNENNAETFAYFNGTNWTVSNVGDATLQVVDVTGRTVANQMINGNAELNLNQPAGVYVIRLVNGDNVKTQKVVVR